MKKILKGEKPEIEIKLKKFFKQKFTVVKNSTEITQGFYDIYQDLHILEPNESKKICTELLERYTQISESEADK